MSDPTKVFAAYLATIIDDAERARELARAKMLGMNAAPEEAFAPPIRTLEDYLAAEIEIPPVLIHPTLVVRGGVNATIGRAGKGKTVMNLNRMLRWSAGKPMFDDWHDEDGNDYLVPEQPLKILIVENEGAAGMFHRQIGVMLSQSEFMSDADRKMAKENVLIWGEGGYSGLKLDDTNKLNELRAGIEKWEPDMVYIEPFRSLWKGEENSSTEMNVVVDALVEIATTYNCGVVLAHHEKKSGSDDAQEKMNAARGSTVLEGVVTVMENFESVKAGEYRELSWSKVRYQDPDRKFPGTVRMEWVPEAWWYRHIANTQIEDQILRSLHDAPDALTVKGLCDLTEESDAKIRRALKKMRDDGRVRLGSGQSSDGHGSSGATYRLPVADIDTHGGLAV